MSLRVRTELAALPRFAWRPVAAISGVVALVHLVVATRYGWHRDELYYAEAGRHLAFGFVDQPPLTPLIARAADLLPGGVFPLRAVAIAAQVGCVGLAAAIAQQLGGRRKAQTIAAACVAASPLLIGTSMLLGTTVIDEVLWLATIAVTMQSLRTNRTSLWMATGIVGGVALENKQTAVVLVIGTLLGLALLRRDALRRRGPWIAGGVAFTIWLPNIVWNAAHGWASVDMARVIADKDGGPLASIAQVPLTIIAVAGLTIAVLVAGVRWLGVDPTARPHRWLLVIAATAIVVFPLSGGKLYYATPALFPLIADVAIEQMPSTRRWFATPTLVIVIAVTWLASTIALLPVLPASDAVNAEALETYGWPQLARQVAQVARALPPHTVVFTSNYGEAGAISRFGPDFGLDLPVRSGHNAYGYWGPDLAGRPNTVLAVGEFDAHYLERFWHDVERVAAIHLPVRNEERRNDATIFVCREPRGSWAQLWPHLRHLD